jgi:hypothetical protein
MYPHRAEDWAALRRVGRWRFIVGDGVRSALATAFGVVVFGLSGVAYWAYQAGQPLDFHWFQIAGQPGAPVFLFFRHAIALVLVAFLFSLVFWLFAGAKCWWLNERVHAEALANQISNSPPDRELPARPLSSFLVAIGEWLFFGFFFYVPLANNWPQIRLAPFWEAVLLTAGVAGAGLVWCVSFAAWISNGGKALTALVRRLFARDPGPKPILQMLTHPTLGPVGPPAMDRAGPSLSRYRACWYAGSTLLVCAFILSSPLGPFPGARLFNWMVYLGVGVLIAGVGFAAHGSYAELSQRPPALPSESEGAGDPSPALEPAKLRTLLFWAILVIAGIMGTVILRLIM